MSGIKTQPAESVEADDANNISYPSPGAETMDAGPFYHTGTRDGVQEHQEHQEHQDHQEHPEHQEQHEQHEQHEHQEQAGHAEPEQVHVQEQEHPQLESQEPATPHQHVSRPSNLEELQLAAQLGHGLAGTSILPATDPSMDVDESNMRNIMPHPEPDQQHTPSYVHDTPTSDPMAQHSMPVPIGPPLPAQYTMGDGIPPRKRSKVSRACDECRRKKIKCDAQSDNGDNPCSSCARSSIRCLFSRVPQKRGPSKGYIKELADRIHSIENKLESDGSLNQDDIDRLFAPERPRSYNNATPADDTNRKRPFSSMSTGGDFNTPASTRPAPWGSEQRPLQPASTPSESFAAPSYTDNSALAPQPVPMKVDGTPTKPPVAPMDAEMADAEDVPEIDDEVLNEYLTNVQPVYPIMPNDKARMQTLLAQSPSPVRTAFTLALSAVAQSSTGDAKQASTLLHEWENGDSQRTRAADIVHAQTLLLLIIDADWRAASTLPFLLARAVALASTMRLWRLCAVDAADPDADDQLCLRIWWSLILMDRWHAAGTGKPAQIPDSSVVAPAGLENIVGDVCFYLIRVSKLLNRIAFVIFTLQPGVSTADASVAAILADYIEDYRQDLPAHMDAASHPLVHLAYWHCRLLVTLLTPEATPLESLWPTKELANLLSHTPQLKSPLTNHFVSLASMALVKLVKTDRSRDEAAQLMREVLDRPAEWQWDSVRERMRMALGEGAEAAAASQGLQHLADLATAAEGGDGGLGLFLVSGYLDVAG